MVYTVGYVTVKNISKLSSVLTLILVLAPALSTMPLNCASLLFLSTKRTTSSTLSGRLKFSIMTEPTDLYLLSSPPPTRKGKLFINQKPLLSFGTKRSLVQIQSPRPLFGMAYSNLIKNLSVPSTRIVPIQSHAAI